MSITVQDTATVCNKKWINESGLLLYRVKQLANKNT